MKILFYLIVFIFGLVTGSFLNVVIYRLDKKESSLRGRSHCPHCNHKLAWYDLIPLFSYLFLRGRCRYCGKKISAQYPLVEMITGILFVLTFNYISMISGQAYLTAEFIFNYLYLLLISSFLIIIFVYDLKHYIIPDEVIYPAIIFASVFYLFSYLVKFNSYIGLEKFLLNPFLSAIVASFFFFCLWFFSRGTWMGFGDVKLAFLMGLILGWPKIFLALFLSFFIGAIMGVGLILVKRKSVKSQIPFAPFLVGGTFIALFWGDKIINFYLNIFHI